LRFSLSLLSYPAITQLYTLSLTTLFRSTELLHTVQPIGFMLFWICFISKDGLTWKGFLPWLLYPLLYILYVMILGALTAHYPYPFADASKLGYPKALLNGMGVLFLIATLALILLGLVKLTFSHKKTHHP